MRFQQLSGQLFQPRRGTPRLSALPEHRQPPCSSLRAFAELPTPTTGHHRRRGKPAPARPRHGTARCRARVNGGAPDPPPPPPPRARPPRRRCPPPPFVSRRPRPQQVSGGCTRRVGRPCPASARAAAPRAHRQRPGAQLPPDDDDSALPAAPPGGRSRRRRQRGHGGAAPPRPPAGRLAHGRRFPAAPREREGGRRRGGGRGLVPAPP